MAPVKRARSASRANLERSSTVGVQSLAQWFDAGYAQNDGNVSGRKPLPSGYSGNNDENVFVKTKANGIVVWPVRLNLGEMPEDDQALKSTTCTLYHYTHRQSLVNCAEIFSQVADSSVKENALRHLLFLIKEDCRLRSSLLDPTNPHEDKVLLTSLEPTVFENSAGVQEEILGRNCSSQKVETLGGEEISAKEIGKCCIAIRVRAVMCSKVKPSNSQKEVVILNADRLDREIQKRITSRVVQQKKEEEEKKAASKKKWCFPWPFGNSKSRGKSREALDKKLLDDESPPEQAGRREVRRLGEMTAEQKKREYRVRQLNDEIREDTKARVQQKLKLDNIKEAAIQKPRGKSRGASQRKSSLSVVGTDRNSGKNVKGSKLGTELSAIGVDLETGSSSDSGRVDSQRLERTEYSATLKTKGSWKQLSKRQELAADSTNGSWEH